MKIIVRLFLSACFAIALLSSGVFVYSWISAPRPNEATRFRILNTISTCDQLNQEGFEGGTLRVARSKPGPSSITVREFAFLPSTNKTKAVAFRFYHNSGGRYIGNYDGKRVSFSRCGSLRLWGEGEFDPREITLYHSLNDVVLTNIVETTANGKKFRYLDVTGWYENGRRYFERINNPTPEQERAITELVQGRLASASFPSQLETMMQSIDSISNAIIAARRAVEERINLFSMATNTLALHKGSAPKDASGAIEYPVMIISERGDSSAISEVLNIHLPPAVQYIETPVRDILVNGEFLSVDPSNGTWRLNGYRCPTAYIICSNGAPRIPFEEFPVSHIMTIILLDAYFQPNPAYNSASDRDKYALHTTITAYAISPSTKETRAVASYEGEAPVAGQGNGVRWLKGNGYGEAVKAMQENFLNKL